jgi:hypothetical protein
MDLNTATNEQLDAFRATVAKTMAIDPMMLDFIWMNDPETGLRNRVLYAKRGVAEVLRHELGISITGLTPSESNGLITFTATGVNKSGRQEMAVGSAYIESQRGDKKAHAMMTAQTRAVRRLTLQFVTGGVLDETEVQAQSELQGPSAASGAALAGSPMVIPPPLAPVAPTNASPGKDITPQPTEFEKQVVIPMAKELGYATAEEFSAAQQALRDEASAALKGFNSSGLPAKDPISTTVETPAPIEIPAKVKRTRKSRNTVSIVSPGQEPAPAAIPEINARHPQGCRCVECSYNNPPVSTHAAKAKELLDQVNNELKMAAVEKAQPVPAQALVAPPSPPTAALEPEKAKEFRERLRVYYNDVLPKGGMLPSENIGGPTMKMRKFATTHTGAGDMNSLSLAQWEDLFDFLDNYTKTNGAQALVQYIDKSIGVTK